MNQSEKISQNDPNHAEQAGRESEVEQPPTSEVAELITDPAVDSRGFETGPAARAKPKTSSRVRRRLHCFQCNRIEGHFLGAQSRWFYSFLLGLTFGLVKLFGPYQCQCCGGKRLMFSNSLNPRYLYRSFRNQGIAKQKNR